MQKFTWKEMSPIYIHVWIQLENVSISCYIDFLFFVCSNRNWHWFGHLFRRHFEQRCEQLWIPCHSQHARDNLLLVQERRSSSAVSTILLCDTFCPPWLDWLAYKSVESNRMFFSSISWEKLISFFGHFCSGLCLDFSSFLLIGTEFSWKLTLEAHYNSTYPFSWNQTPWNFHVIISLNPRTLLNTNKEIDTQFNLPFPVN